MVSGYRWIPPFSHFVVWKESGLCPLLAIINNRAFDACSLLAMGGLMLSFWLKEQSAIADGSSIIGLVMLLFAVVINQLAQHLMPVKRASPRSRSARLCSDGRLSRPKMRRRQFSRRSRHDVADFRHLHVALFWPSGIAIALTILSFSLFLGS